MQNLNLELILIVYDQPTSKSSDNSLIWKI